MPLSPPPLIDCFLSRTFWLFTVAQVHHWWLPNTLRRTCLSAWSTTGLTRTLKETKPSFFSTWYFPTVTSQSICHEKGLFLTLSHLLSTSLRCWVSALTDCLSSLSGSPPASPKSLVTPVHRSGRSLVLLCYLNTLHAPFKLRTPLFCFQSLFTVPMKSQLLYHGCWTESFVPFL